MDLQALRAILSPGIRTLTKFTLLLPDLSLHFQVLS